MTNKNKQTFSFFIVLKIVDYNKNLFSLFYAKTARITTIKSLENFSFCKLKKT